jgi:hypothetical protein
VTCRIFGTTARVELGDLPFRDHNIATPELANTATAIAVFKFTLLIQQAQTPNLDHYWPPLSPELLLCWAYLLNHLLLHEIQNC